MTDKTHLESDAKPRDQQQGTMILVKQPNPNILVSPTLTNWVLAVIGLVCCVCGVGAIAAQKWQARTIARKCGDLFSPACDPAYFKAPIWQTQVMFTAESICFVIWYLDRILTSPSRAKRTSTNRPGDSNANEASQLSKRQQVFRMIKPSSICSCATTTNPPYAWLLWAIPAALDLLAATMTNVAFTFTFASTVQMMRSFCVIATAAISLFIIRKPLLVHQWIGIIGITVGMCVAGLGAVIYPEERTASPSMHYTLLGILLAVAATTIQSLQLVLEEAILRHYLFDPLQAMGIQGLVGFVVTLNVLWISHLVGFENSQVTAYQTMASTKLMLSNGVYLFTCFFLNSSGILLTQLGGSVLKGIIFSLRAPVLWLFELCLGWHYFDWPNLVGLLIIIPCFLIYSKTPSHKSQIGNALRQPVSCYCTLPYEHFQQDCVGRSAVERVCTCGGLAAKPASAVPCCEDRAAEINVPSNGSRVGQCVVQHDNSSPPVLTRGSFSDKEFGEALSNLPHRPLTRARTPPVWPLVAVTPPPRRATTPSRCYKCESERQV